jgi:hypothetical protein
MMMRDAKEESVFELGDPITANQVMKWTLVLSHHLLEGSSERLWFKLGGS